MKDLFNNINLKPALGPAAYDSSMDSTTGTAIDGRGFGSITYAIQLGSVTDTNATFAVRLEEGDDTTAFTTVADGDLLGTTTLAAAQYDDDNECRKIGYLGIKRYTRLVVVPTNMGEAGKVANISATCILGHPQVAPTANPPA